MAEYACTYISKDVEDDSYDGGCDPKSRRTVLSERCNITADSLGELIKEIGLVYCLEIDDVWFPPEQHDDSSEDTRIGFSRLENGDSDEPSEDEMRRFNAGEITLYLADYDFTIEKRAVSPVTLDDFKAAGIKTHD